MKRIFAILSIILLGWGWTNLCAWDCESMRKAIYAPEYYCACKYDNITFSNPMTISITDSLWLQAQAKDVLGGLSAYWYSNDGATMDIYAFCSSYTPLVSLSVGANCSFDFSLEKLQEKSKEYGDSLIEKLTGSVDPHARVKMNHVNRQGTLICYPYNVGPETDCGKPMSIRNYMRFVTSHETDVYLLEPQYMPKDGYMFVHWQEEENKPCSFYMTRGKCDGDIVGSWTMADSLRPYFLDSAYIRMVKNSGDSLYFHVQHDSSYVGRVTFYTTPMFETRMIDTAACYELDYLGKTYTKTGKYFADTIWGHTNTLYIDTLDLTIIKGKDKKDTKYLEEKDLPYLYHGLVIEAVDTADYEVIEWSEDSTFCSRYQLHVEPKLIEEAIENITSCNEKGVYISREGWLYIERSGKRYNLLGQPVGATKNVQK